MIKFSFLVRFLIALSIIIGGVGFYIGNIFYKEAIYKDTKKYEDQSVTAFSENYYDEDEYLKLKIDTVSIESKYGYTLYGDYIRNNKKSDKAVVLVHGITGSRWPMLRFVRLYLDRGYNVLIYDGRNHGKSEGKDVSYGYYEKYDLDKWVDFLKDKYKNRTIGIHGESMGAATALQHVKLNNISNKVNFYIADCSYSDLVELFYIRLGEDFGIRNKILARPIMFFANVVSRIRSGFTFDDISPIKSIEDSNVPILFIHGDVDKYVPTYMSEDMYNNKSNNTELYIVKNAGHAEAYIKDKIGYVKRVYKFLDNIGY